MSDNQKFVDLLLKDRYYRDGESTWEKLCERVARYLSDVDYEDDDEHAKKYEQYKDLMVNRKFLPASPILMSAGTDYFMGASCFVFDIEDTLESIMNTVKLAALVFARGGGCGYSLSALRPKGSLVSSTGTRALGSEGVIRLIDAMTQQIRQLRRRGANLATISVENEDIESFIDLKKTDGTITNFNLSVSITDDFMVKVKDGEKKACKLWDKIIKSSWSGGEPGCIFIDTVNRASPYMKHGLKINATNPCGEEPLPAHGSCLLGSINLSSLVDDKGSFQKKEFRSIIKIAYDMLNSVLDHSKFPSSEILEFAIKYRPIGLGITGFADMLIKMGIVYGSEESYGMANYIGKTLKDITDKLKIAYNNITALTVAPTGSISILMKCSFGLEPNYAYKTDRPFIDNNDVKHNFKLVSPLLEEDKYKKECFITSTDVTPDQHIEIQTIFQKYIDAAISKTIILPHDYTLEQTKEIYMKAYEKKLKGITIYRDMSKKDQVYTTSKVEDKDDSERDDTAASKRSALAKISALRAASSNLSEGEVNDRRTEDAFHQSIAEPKDQAKDCSRDALLYPDRDDKKLQQAVPPEVIAADFKVVQTKKRPKKLPGYTYKCKIPGGSFYITITHNGSSAFEVFATSNIDDKGNTQRANEANISTEALTRIISLALRSGVKPEKIVEQLDRVKNQSMLSMPHQLATILSETVASLDSTPIVAEPPAAPSGRKCNSCQKMTLQFSGDCWECSSCGWSRCS